MSPRPELYWISGSPPSWCVMLGLVFKSIEFSSKRLDHGAGENKHPKYLALNPKGQVPTFVHGDIVMRESIAILAYLDVAWPSRPIFGSDPAQHAAIWQDVMIFENDLRPTSTLIAQTLFRGKAYEVKDELARACDSFAVQLDILDQRLSGNMFLGGDMPMASDAWLFPTMGWIERALEKSADQKHENVSNLINGRKHISAWRENCSIVPVFQILIPHIGGQNELPFKPHGQSAIDTQT